MRIPVSGFAANFVRGDAVPSLGCICLLYALLRATVSYLMLCGMPQGTIHIAEIHLGKST